VQRILLESPLWGQDFAALLAQVPVFRDAGETSVYVFADRAAGASAAPAQAPAQQRLQRARAGAAKPAQLQPPFVAMQKQAAAAQAAPLRLELGKLIDGDGFHLVAIRPGTVELLAPGLTVAAVRTRLGAPERVLQQTIHAEGESKPVVLTLHIYAGNAVAFAESNMAEPGIVERVVLNLPLVVPAVIR